MKNAVLFLIIILIWRSPTAFSDQNRTAIWVDASLRNEPYGELLMVELSGREIPLVEREELDSIRNERTEWGFGEASASRIGRLLGANHLVLLDRPPATGRAAAVRFKLVDVSTGLRLDTEVVAVDSPESVEDSMKLLADRVVGVRTRFPNGVESVVAVTPWMSKNLTREYDSLQTSLAELLSHGLQHRPGLAVVEIEEARRVAEERGVSGVEAAARISPWVIEGRFELQPVMPDQPRKVDLVATLGRVGNPGKSHLWEKEGIPLERVGKTVEEETVFFVLRALSKSTVDLSAGTPGGTFEALVKRAERFTEIGMWEEAAALREAAVVSDPEHESASSQTLAAAWDYVRLLQDGLIQSRMHPSASADHRQQTETLLRNLSLWRRALVHLEFLIRNRHIDGLTAHDLGKEVLAVPRRGRDIWHGSAQILVAADEDRRQFLLTTWPRVFDLPGSRGQSLSPQVASRCVGVALDNAVSSYYGQMIPADLNVFAALLISKLPQDIPPTGQVVRYRVGAPLTRFKDKHFHEDYAPGVEPPLTAGQWMETMHHLRSQSKLDRPVAWAVGEYAVLSEKRWGLKKEDVQERQKLYEQVVELESAWTRMDMRGHKSDDAMASVIKELRIRLQPRPSHPNRPVPRPTPRPEKELDPLDWLEPVDLVFVDENGVEQAPNTQWFDVLAVEGEPQGLLNVWVSNTSVYFERRPGKLEVEMTLPRHSWVTSARWDGQYVWIANPRQGITLLDAAGEIAGVFDKESGLPDQNWNLLIQPLSKGRAIVAGSHRKDGRSWIAECWLDASNRPRIEILHTAVRQSGWKDRTERDWDTQTVGRYAWTWIWNRKGGERYLILGSRRMPRALNLTTHEVSTIGPPRFQRGVFNPFVGEDPYWYSFQTVPDDQGKPTHLLLAAGTYGVRLLETGSEPMDKTLSIKRIDEWTPRDSVDMGNIRNGRLIPRPDGAFLFTGHGAGGMAIIRVDVNVPEPRLLVTPLSPPQFKRIHAGSSAPATGHGILLWKLSGHPDVSGKVFRLKSSTPEGEPETGQ